MINNNGPSLEPCGTPAFISKGSDFTLSTTTICCMPAKYEPTVLRKVPSTPIWLNLASKPLCQTLSNAALTSKNKPCVIFFICPILSDIVYHVQKLGHC